MEEVPSEIVGRFSQRLHSTIQKIGPYRLRLLTIAMYESRSNHPAVYNIPKLRIGKYNFIRSLNYAELEDLMAFFIYQEHKGEGYMLKPSSCKMAEPKYEFRFMNPLKKIITCQVKNEKNVNPKDYENENDFERIYLFSGKWTEQECADLVAKYNGKSNIHIVSRNELYNCLSANRSFMNPFYDFDNEPVKTTSFSLKGYEKYDVTPNSKKAFTNYKGDDFRRYMIDDAFICFCRDDCLFYSSEFDALVLSRHLQLGQDGQRKEQEYAEMILKDLNREC